MDEEKKHYVSWRNQTLGPHTIGEIKAMLGERKIHSLFKVQCDDGDILVREFLAGMHDDLKRQSSEKDNPLQSQPVKKAIIFPDGDDPVDFLARDKLSTPPAIHSDNPLPIVAGEPKFSYAVSSLVLSLLFALPLINLISWVMSLIFGFLFLQSAKGDKTKRGYLHAWCGVWLTCIFGLFYMISCLTFAIAGSRNPDLLIEVWWPIIHVLMLSGAVASSVVSGLLIAATKMITGAMPKISVAFVAGTLGVLIGIILQIFLYLIVPDAFATQNTTLLVSLFLAIAVFLIQALAWANLIQVRDGEKLGLGRSLIVSLFCSISQLFITILLIFFGSMLN